MRGMAVAGCSRLLRSSCAPAPRVGVRCAYCAQPPPYTTSEQKQRAAAHDSLLQPWMEHLSYYIVTISNSQVVAQRLLKLATT